MPERRPGDVRWTKKLAGAAKTSFTTKCEKDAKAKCDVDAKAWVCWYRDQQSLSATVPKYYDIRRVGFGDTRYGGPGQ